MSDRAVLAYERVGDAVAIELRGLDPPELSAVLAGFWCALPPADRTGFVALLADNLRTAEQVPPPDDEDEVLPAIAKAIEIWLGLMGRVRAGPEV